jgi:hypothetical protein
VTSEELEAARSVVMSLLAGVTFAILGLSLVNSFRMGGRQEKGRNGMRTKKNNCSDVGSPASDWEIKAANIFSFYFSKANYRYGLRLTSIPKSGPPRLRSLMTVVPRARSGTRPRLRVQGPVQCNTRPYRRVRVLGAHRGGYMYSIHDDHKYNTHFIKVVQG